VGATAFDFRLTQSATVADGFSVWPAYQSIFGDFPAFEAWRDEVWNKHRVRSGFRLARAYDGDAVAGFAYGYTGEPGQWWTDNARAVLPSDVADAWLGGHFEVVTVGVVAQARRHGIGRELMRLLVDGLPHDRLLLMSTADSADPARLLYASLGWRVLGPGIGDGTVILGKRV
jgi:ribosomal protein S18 acetylase RimI-like enzyme